MRVLLVQGRSAPTYWSYEFSLRFIAKDAALPPLGLITLAALLPPAWELRLADLNVRPVADAEIAWADAVFVSGMLVQAESMRETLRRARRIGRRTVVGGPAATSTPQIFPEADHVFCGEAEGRIASLVEVLEDSVHDDLIRASAYWNLRDAGYPKGKPGRYSFRFALRPGR